MIKLVRVDHRLVHGQVALSWTKHLHSNCILVASNDIVGNELKMNVMRMAKPADVKLVMKNIEDSVSALKSGSTDKYELMILCESIKEVYDLATNYPEIKEINIGGIKKSEDRKEISKAVFMSDEEISLVKELCDKGIRVFVQLVPNDQEVDILKLI